MSRLRVAIDKPLKNCPLVITLGVRRQIADYTGYERELLRAAEMVFYPTSRFVDVFANLGKKTFPSTNCYRLQGDRLKQTALLRLLNVPHPRTRVYYGHRQKREIIKDFAFPFVAKKPFGPSESGQVYFISDQEKLDWYNQHFNPAYIQEYLHTDRELRVAVLNYYALFGYWRNTSSGVHRTDSLSRGGWPMDVVPPEAAVWAKKVAWNAGLSDVTLDMIYDGSCYWVLGLSFEYSEEKWLQPGKDRFKMIVQMIERGEL